MPRARILKPGFFSNELLAELPFEGRLLFAGLWTLADREGRLQDRPKRIKGEIFPFDEVDVAGLLNALEQKGFIERYTRGAMPLIQVVEFLTHQTPHAREAASVLPAPDSEPRKGSAQPSPRSPVYGNGSDPVCGNGTGCAEPSSPPPPFLVFPVTGQGKGGEWGLPVTSVEEFERLFPGLDVRGEMRKALAWAKTNPGRQKTGRGMPAFLNRWLARTADRRGGDERRQEERREKYIWPCPHNGIHSAKWPCCQQQDRERTV